MKQVQSSLEYAIYQASGKAEAKALAAIGTSPKYAIQILTDCTASCAETALAEWKKFGEKIIVKYNDFVVKSENSDGSLNRGTTGRGGRLVRTGYPEEYWKQVVRQTGDKYLMPESK